MSDRSINQIIANKQGILQIKTAAWGRYLPETNESLAGHHQKLAAQGIVDTAPEIPFNIEVTNLSNSCIKIAKIMYVTKYLPVSPMWFERPMEEDKLDNVNVVQIYKASKNKQEIIDEHYDTMQQNASL